MASSFKPFNPFLGAANQFNVSSAALGLLSALGRVVRFRNFVLCDAKTAITTV
jgi:hypothetical protein